MDEASLPGLHWGIKASFLEYVARMPDGRGTVSDGATPIDGNIMVFEMATAVEPPAPQTADRLLSFRGDVRFGGHMGMLFVRIADPWIAITAHQAEMTVLDPFQPDEDLRLPLVRFTLTPTRAAEDVEVLYAAEVRLTVEGTRLFNDVYPTGELFEPLRIVLPAADSAAQSRRLFDSARQRTP